MTVAVRCYSGLVRSDIGFAPVAMHHGAGAVLPEEADVAVFGHLYLSVVFELVTLPVITTPSAFLSLPGVAIVALNLLDAFAVPLDLPIQAARVGDLGNVTLGILVDGWSFCR